ncbi:class II fructose-bisphosphate aldolase [Leifsonia sp. 1010]|uniref:class II fructose-bisphosphate aldolase n=1 Tax=Leifsonia sp. 1010 TaxID=2817769 RepID=UPI002857A3DA|nr:class II fructose-bisphosphate aldolase [Leifsonia sp. 1010]MDR6610770.1 fructose-bisphosphate aldolase class II [Leifsonia sp. 1010]
MSLVSPADLLVDGSTGVAAFNVILTEHLEAFVAAAEERSSGLILQLSQNAVRYHGSLEPVGSAILAAARRASVPIAVQLDHADDAELIREAAALGFTSVMYDGSRLPYAENVERTASLSSELHDSGIWVEAELGEVGGKDGVHSATARTDPAEAAEFVANTGVDGLAIAVGSSHAMTEQSAMIDLALIRAVRGRVSVPLVLHGSSGVSDELVREAVRAGIRKVNVGTRFNAVFTEALRGALAVHPEAIDPRRYLRPARDAVAADAAHLLGVIGGR